MVKKEKLFLTNKKIIIIILVLITITNIVIIKPVKADVFFINNCQTLNTPDSTYYLQNDVYSDNSCFDIRQRNITLNLMGHTISYGYSEERGYYHGIGCSAYARDNINILNGTIVQGTGNFEQYYTPAIGCGADDSSIHDMKIIITANQSECIAVGSPHNMSIFNNFCYIADRSVYKGYGISLGGDGTDNIFIYNNTIVGGHRGIHIENGGNNIYLFNNRIQHVRSLGRKSPQGIYFGGGGYNHYIYNNELISDFGRGIKLSGWNNDVHDNIIDVQYSLRATEGIGSQPYVENRCYGVWSRQGGNTTLHNNKILVNNLVMNDSGSGVIGVAIYGEPNWNIYDNTIAVSHKDPGAESRAIYMNEAYGVDCDNIRITNNDLTSQHIVCDLSNGNNLILTNNRFIEPINHRDDWQALQLTNINGITEPNTIISEEQTTNRMTNPSWVKVIKHKLGSYIVNEIRWDASSTNAFTYKVYKDGAEINNEDYKSSRAGSFFVDTDGGDHCYGVASTDKFGNSLEPVYESGCRSCIDNDGDGYGEGFNCRGPDCDDSNSEAHETITCEYNGHECGETDICATTCPAPPAERCNGIDDDCDGEIDETFTPGTCSFVCESIDGMWGNNYVGGMCCGDDPQEGHPFEEQETFCFDNKDNDCDGLIDQDDPDCESIAKSDIKECDNWQEEHPEWIFCDDFETSSINDYDGGWSQYVHYEDTSTTSSDNILTGDRSLLLQVTPDINSGAGIYKNFGPHQGTIYVRYYAKFDKNYDDQGRMHFISLRALDPTTPCGCIGCCANQRPQGNDRFGTAIEFYYENSMLRSHTYTYFYNQRNPSSSYHCCPKPLSTWARSFEPEEPEYIDKGSWHEIEFMIKQNTPGRDDGAQAYWIDGNLILNSTIANPPCGPYPDSTETTCEEDDPSVDVYSIYNNPPPYNQVYPGEGYVWRTTDNLAVNYIWIELYNHLASTNKQTNKAWVDNLIVSQEYIGPMKCPEDEPIRAPCYCGEKPTETDSSTVHSQGFCHRGTWRPEMIKEEYDLNNDNIINIIDLLIFGKYWGLEDDRADLNNDRNINYEDAELFLNNW